VGARFSRAPPTEAPTPDLPGRSSRLAGLAGEDDVLQGSLPGCAGRSELPRC